LIDLLRRQMRLTRERHFPRKRTICAIFSMSVNKAISLDEVLDRFYPQFADERPGLAELFKAFEEFKRGHHMLTYDDLLVRLREALEASDELCRRLSEQYRYVMVDEYQDTNKLQAQIVRLMSAAHDNVAVVGDECQSIYSFRGASFQNMLEFPALFPRAEVIKLEENFRSTQPILNLANALISDVKEGYAKRLYLARARRAAAAPRQCARRERAVAVRRRAHRRVARGGHAAARHRRAVPRRLPLVRFGDRIGQARDSVPQIRRNQVRRVGPHQRRAGLPADRRQPLGHALVVPRAEAD